MIFFRKKVPRDHLPMLVEKLPVWALGLVLVVYITLVACSFALGILASPSEWDTHSVSSWQCPYSEFNDSTRFNPSQCIGDDLSNGGTWEGSVVGVSKMNQVLLLKASVMNLLHQEEGVEKHLGFNVELRGRTSETADIEVIYVNDVHYHNLICPEDQLYCDDATLVYLPFVSYYEYDVTVSLNSTEETFVGDIVFTFVLVDYYYTMFEIWFRFGFLMLSFLSLIVLTFNLRNNPWDQWSSEQQWVAILLFGTMAYDNPFFSLQILVQGWFFPLLDEFFMITYIALLLLFLIITLDSLRKPLRSFLRGHWLKVIIVGSIWLICLVAGIIVETKQVGSLEYGSPSEIPFHDDIFLAVVILTGIYLFYLIYIYIRCFKIIRRVGRTLGKRMLFFIVTSTFVIITAVVGIIVSFTNPSSFQVSIFLSYLAIFNLYTAVLAIMYMPWAWGQVQGPIRDRRFGSSASRVSTKDDESFRENETDISLEVIEDVSSK